jgi:phage protein D
VEAAAIAKARAEIDARAAAAARQLAYEQAKAAEEARIQKEEEAKAKADAEAKAREEEHAIARAEIEAFTRAEAETRAKANAEAKAKAEAEAKAMLAERAIARAQRFSAAAMGLPVPANDAQKGDWYYIMNNEVIGPIRINELKRKIDDPEIVPPLKMIWTAGMGYWTPVYECSELWAKENEEPSNA